MVYTAPVRNDHKYWKIYVEIVLLSLICVTQYFGIAMASLALTCCVIGIHFLMSDIEECTIGLFCALPMFNFLNIRMGAISFYYLMVFVFWLRYLQYHDWKISKNKFLVLFALFVIRITAGEIKETLTWFVLISVLVLSYGEAFLDRNIQRIVLFTTIVFLISSFAGYLMLKAGKSIYTGGRVWTGKVKSIRFGGIVGNSVFFSQLCAFLAAANLTLACYNRRYLLIGVLFAGCCLLLCLETYAKTGMLLIALCAGSSVVWLIWNRIQSKRTAIFSILLLFSGVIGSALLVNYILTNTDNLIIQNYVTRLSQEDLFTGRLEIWEHYFSLLGNSWRSLICALPAKDYFRMFTLSDGRAFNDPHNILLETVCLFGIIPALCMMLLVFERMYHCFVSKKGILWQMPICVILASGFSLHGHLEFHYYTLVAIAISFLQCPPAPVNRLDSSL